MASKPDEGELCVLCGKPTRLPVGKMSIPVRHKECHERFMVALLAGPGRPVNELARQRIREWEEREAKNK